MKIYRYFTFLFLSILTSYININASPIDESNIIKGLVKLFSRYNTFALSFSEVHADYSVSQGYIFIDKPHNIRVNYDNPHEVLILNNEYGLQVYEYRYDTTLYGNSRDHIVIQVLLDTSTAIGNFELIDIEMYQFNKKEWYKVIFQHSLNNTIYSVIVDTQFEHLYSLNKHSNNSVVMTILFGKIIPLNKMDKKWFLIYKKNSPKYIPSKMIIKQNF